MAKFINKSQDTTSKLLPKIDRYKITTTNRSKMKWIKDLKINKCFLVISRCRDTTQ